VSKKFGEWYQKTNKTEDTNKLTSLAFKIITIIHNTLLATFIHRTAVTCSWIAAMSAKCAPFVMLFRRGNRKKSTHCTPLIWHPRAPDQGSTVDFLLFPCLKRIMKGACFANMAAIQERVTAVLRSVRKEAFTDSFQKLYEHCK
jgi:hypothetical protein